MAARTWLSRITREKERQGDETLAIAADQRACDGGEARGCVGIAVLQFMDTEGFGGAKSNPELVDTYQKACDSGDMKKGAPLSAFP